jgi:integrase
MQAEANNPSPNQKIFKIQDAKKALTSACSRLGLHHFTQRNLRQLLIRQLWQKGIDRKLIAKWQGHRDGGRLIIDTYTDVFGDDDAAYRLQELKKLLPA